MAPTNPEHSRRVQKKSMSTGQTKPFKVIKPKRSKRVKRSSKIRMMNWIKKLNIKYGFESSANMASIQTTTKKAANLIDLPAEVRHLIFSAVLRGCHKDCISHDITKPTSGEMYISLCCMPAIKAAILGLAFASKAFLADLDHFVSDLHLYCTLAEYRKDRLSTVPHVLRVKVVQFSVAETKRVDCASCTTSARLIQYNVVKLFPQLKRVSYCAGIHIVALKTLQEAQCGRFDLVVQNRA